MLKNWQDKLITTDKQEILLRQPQREDIVAVTEYARELALEDTFITLSPDWIPTADEQENYLQDAIKQIEVGDKFQIFGFYKDKLVVNAELRRNTKGHKRSEHMGEIGISIAKGWRQQGLGRKIFDIFMTEAAQVMKLRLITLTVFSINQPAIDFYSKMGFHRAGEIPGAVLYKGNYINSVIMYKHLY